MGLGPPPSWRQADRVTIRVRRVNEKTRKVGKIAQVVSPHDRRERGNPGCAGRRLEVDGSYRRYRLYRFVQFRRSPGEFGSMVSRLVMTTLEDRSAPAVFTVNTTADNGDNGSPTPGSLR